jgi:RES domain-containing protein
VSEIVVWRLCADYRIPWAFSGNGSAQRGGRWNPPGVRLVYCAESRALAALEVLVHVDELQDLGAIKWVCISATVPSDVLESPSKFPDDWRQYPYSAGNREFGAEWARSDRSVALRVPSVIVPGEFNYLLNPAHADFKHVKIGKPESFAFDPRL